MDFNIYIVIDWSILSQYVTFYEVLDHRVNCIILITWSSKYYYFITHVYACGTFLAVYSFSVHPSSLCCEPACAWISCEWSELARCFLVKMSRNYHDIRKKQRLYLQSTPSSKLCAPVGQKPRHLHRVKPERCTVRRPYTVEDMLNRMLVTVVYKEFDCRLHSFVYPSCNLQVF